MRTNGFNAAIPDGMREKAGRHAQPSQATNAEGSLIFLTKIILTMKKKMRLKIRAQLKRWAQPVLDFIFLAGGFTVIMVYIWLFAICSGKI